MCHYYNLLLSKFYHCVNCKASHYLPWYNCKCPLTFERALRGNEPVAIAWVENSLAKDVSRYDSEMLDTLECLQKKSFPQFVNRTREHRNPRAHGDLSQSFTSHDYKNVLMC